MNRDKQRSSVQTQRLRKEQVNIKKEFKYIINKAMKRDPRIVRLCPLIFFSTKTGDARVLDYEDNLALCLVRGGEVQPYVLREQKENYRIGWNSSYKIEGDLFMVATTDGPVISISGYPTQEITETLKY